MPSQTGYWDKEEAAINHDFSECLAEWIAAYLPKDKPVVDFGAGNGAYIRYLHDAGFTAALAIEGDKTTVTQTERVMEADLTKPFSIQNYFNSICLEVGEHLPQEYLSVFINNLTNNTKDKLILSWAVPGQGGYHHVSCRHNIWVINELEKRGFTFLAQDSLDARHIIEYRLDYFKNTIMIFKHVRFTRNKTWH